MAEVITKSNVFNSSKSLHNHTHNHNQHRFSVSPIKSLYFSSSTSTIGFKPLSLSVKRQFNSRSSSSAKMSIGIGKLQRWWEKGVQQNMREISGAQDLVDSLSKAGDKLVVVDFFSPGCGGCKALHPKICQLAEQNPDVEFLQVNYEDHKSMCYSLNVHVLPFFRFYRGAQGRVCSFSCTNATIKKFKDALAKHSPDRCGLGPTKGLEEKELIALASNRDLSFTYTPQPIPQEDVEVEVEVEVESCAVAPQHHPSLSPITTRKSSERFVTTAPR